MVTLAGLQNVVAGGGSNDGQGDGAARRAVGYKGVDSKVHPKGSYERSVRQRKREEGGEREGVGRRVGSERERGSERARENLRPPVNSYRTSYRAHTYVHTCVSLRLRARAPHTHGGPHTRAWNSI